MASLQSEEQHARSQEILQHFTLEFVEKHKNNFLFFCVVEAITAGHTPYTIIEEFIEMLADFKI